MVGTVEKLVLGGIAVLALRNIESVGRVGITNTAVEEIQTVQTSHQAALDTRTPIQEIVICFIAVMALGQR